MKKSTILLGAVLTGLTSLVSAHQVNGEFHDNSWNWVNGNHFGTIANDTNSVSTIHMHTVEKMVEKMADSKAVDKIDSNNSKMSEKIDNIPMYDTGIKPVNSK